MNVCTVRLRGGMQNTFRDAKGEEHGFNLIVDDANEQVIARFDLPDVSSWWNDEENSPEEGESVDYDRL